MKHHDSRVLRGSLISAGFLMCLSMGTSGQTATIRDIATDATDPNNFTDFEPSIAVNPRNNQHIAVVAFSGNWGPGVSAPVWQSLDGGLTWTRNLQIPAPSINGGPGDQKVVFDAAGNLLVVELDGGLNNFVYRQTGAATANLTAGAGFGASTGDQPHLDVDRTSSRPCSNRIYSPLLNLVAGANKRSN